MSGARKVVTRSPHRRVGRIACPWLQPTAIEYESLLERDFVRLALFDLGVTSISHQPFSLSLGDLGTYIPDFLLIGQHEKLVVEVKPAVHATNARNKPRLVCAEGLLREQGYRFMVAPESVVQKDQRHLRAGILLRHARGQISPQLAVRITESALRFPNGVEIRRLATVADTTTQSVLHLVGRRLLRINNALNLGELDLVYPLGGDHVNLYA